MITNENIYAEFLDEMRRTSRNIDDYLATQLYLQELDDPDAITDEIIFNLVLGMVVDELRHMGLSIESSNDIYTTPYLINVIAKLRALFDINQFPKIISNADDLTEQLLQLIGSDEIDETIMCTEIIQFMHERFPLAVQWEFLANHRFEVSNTYLFVDHVRTMAERASVEDTADVHEDVLIQYTEAVQEHHDRVRDNVSTLASHYRMPQDDRTWLSYAMDSHDTELVSKLTPDEMFRYIDPTDPHPAYATGNDVDAIANHKFAKRHHVEHYMINDRKHLLLELKHSIIVAADMYRPAWPLEKNIEVITAYLQQFDVFKAENQPELMTKILDCVNILAQQVR